MPETSRDEIWIARRDILCLIPEPVPIEITASSIGRKLQEAVFGNVMPLYENWQKVKS